MGRRSLYLIALLGIAVVAIAIYSFRGAIALPGFNTSIPAEENQLTETDETPNSLTHPATIVQPQRPTPYEDPDTGSPARAGGWGAGPDATPDDSITPIPWRPIHGDFSRSGDESATMSPAGSLMASRGLGASIAADRDLRLFLPEDDSSDFITQPTVQKHVIQPGDTFWTIAARHYGNGQFYKALYEYNLAERTGDGDADEETIVLIPTASTLRQLYPEQCPR
jgi:nucleoid-associated protein YgaU